MALYSRLSMATFTVALQISCAVLITHGTASEADLITFSGPTMGTRYSVTLASRDDIADLQNKVEVRVVEINGRMSTYDDESELSRFNQFEGTEWFAVSADTARVVKFALGVAELTNGAFDPTVGPAVNLWGFGPQGKRRTPPNDEEIEQALAKIGYQNLEVRTEPPALRKKRADVYLDLSAVAKGYAVDEVAKLLLLEDCRDSLVVIGGEIRASGKKPDGSHWRIGIEQPDSKGEALERKVQIEDMAIGTSGDWQNAFSHDGVRYSHVIDPQTARPVSHNVAGVTVLADRAIQTDAWATALLVMGNERGMAWCEENRVAAVFFIRSPAGKFITQASAHWGKHVIP
jgi:FAD:protein FMN transferase